MNTIGAKTHTSCVAGAAWVNVILGAWLVVSPLSWALAGMRRYGTTSSSEPRC